MATSAMTFKANLLPSSNLGYSLGSEDKKWNIYGELNGNASSADKLSHTPNNTTTFLRGDNTFSNILTGNIYTKGYYMDQANPDSTETHKANIHLWGDVVAFTYRNSDNTYLGDAFYYNINDGNITAKHEVYVTNGNLSVGTAEETTNQRRITLNSGSGDLILFSNASATGYRGLWVNAHGTGAGKNIILIDTNNNAAFTGNADTATALTSNAGGSTHPIYFSGGKPAACNIISSGNYKNGFATAFDANGYGEIAKGLDWHMPTSTNDFDIRLHIEGTHNGLGIAAGTGYNSAFTASNFYGTLNGNAQYLLTAAHPGVAPTYGINRLEYFNASTTAGNSPTAVDSPTSDWYHHLRMNHANSGGYYCDIATCFHSNNMYLKRVTNGSSSGWLHIWVQGNAVTSAVWNDYAEYRESHDTEFGYVIQEIGDDTLQKTTKRLDHFAGVTSDTWGFAQGETKKAKTPIAVAGRVLVYPGEDRNKYQPGDCVCAGPGGKVYIMTREEIREWPDRIVGTVSCVPTYDEWGGGENADRPSVKVNGRIWIKVR